MQPDAVKNLVGDTAPLEIQWSVNPVFGSHLVVVVVALLLLTGLFVFGESKSLPFWKRLILRGIRCLVVVLLVVAMLRPGLTLVRNGTPRGAIAVMVDLSGSMELGGQLSGKTRWELEREVCQRLLTAKDQLGENTALKFFGYDEKLQALGENATPLLPDRPQGAMTNVGVPLGQLLASQIDPPLSAVVWMGDAIHTTRTPAEATPQTDPQQVARQLAQLDIPLYVVGLGPRVDQELLRDLAIDGVTEQLDVYTKNKVNVTGTLRARGMPNRAFPVQLVLRKSDGKYEPLALDSLQVDQTDQSLPFRLALTAPAPGSYEMRAFTPTVDGESQTENNQAVCYLNVREGGLRILYLEGEARIEQRFLRTSLAASQDFKVDYQWIERKSEQGWPKDLREQLASQVYDVYILGDLDSAALGNENLGLLGQRVREGAGLITLGGYFAYGSGGYDKSPLRDVLPIEMGPSFRQVYGQNPIPHAHFATEMDLRPTGVHEVTLLGPERENRDYWKALHPMPGANRWAGAKRIPGVEVLLQGPNREPMLVAGSFEKGKVLSLAFDSTYLWWRQGKSESHRRFWRQAVNFVKRGSGKDGSLELSMSKRRLFRGESADLELVWQGGAQQAPFPPNTSLRWVYLPESKSGPSGDRGSEEDLGPISLTPKDANTMTGKVVAPTKAGRYELRAHSHTVAAKIETKMPFIVLDQSLESMQPIPDWSLMTQMARINEPAGGTLVDVRQLDELIELLLDRKEKSTLRQIETHNLGQGKVDSWLAFLSLFVAIALQWWLRKRWNLV
jgi:uncharacterized membrane protein